MKRKSTAKTVYRKKARITGKPYRIYSKKTEIKTKDTTNNTAVGVYTPYYATFDSNGIICNQIRQGSDYNERIGNKIRVKSIQISAYCFPSIPSDATRPIFSPIRCLVVYDKQSNGNTFTNTGFFLDNSFVLGFQDPAFAERYKVLVNSRQTMTHYPTATGPGETDTSTLCFEEYRKFKRPLDVLYNANTGTVGDLQTGAIWCIFYSDTPNTGVTNNRITVHYDIRIRYYDN